MTRVLTYSDVDPNGLHDELLAAGIVPLHVGGIYDAEANAQINGAVAIEVADAVDEAAVAAVVGAHSRQAAEQRRAAAQQDERDDDAAVPVALAEIEAALAANPTGVQRAILRALRLLLRRERRRQGG